MILISLEICLKRKKKVEWVFQVLGHNMGLLDVSKSSGRGGLLSASKKKRKLFSDKYIDDINETVQFFIVDPTISSSTNINWNFGDGFFFFFFF